MTITSTHQRVTCSVYKYDAADYRELAALQEELREGIISRGERDCLLFVQHLPVITVGASGSTQDILVTDAFLKEKRIDVVRTDRGGKITYHGPGQLVVYPIFDLRRRDRDVHLFVRRLEEVVIRVLHDYGISALRKQGYPGVWVGEAKICSVGVGMKRWVTKHGLALNVTADLVPFSYINPCGTQRDVTSIEKLLSKEISMGEVMNAMVRHFSDVFDLNITLKAT